MTEMPIRRKQPQRVRRNLLDCAAEIVLERGLGHLTLQAVAEAAGVTKGGLFHHFPNRQALVESMVGGLLERLDAEIDQRMAEDPHPYGRFTRAYVEMVFAGCGSDAAQSPWPALAKAMMAEVELAPCWTEWLKNRLDRHGGTDGGALLEIVRLAADGAWLASAMRADRAMMADPAALHARLIALTQPTK